MSLFFFVRIAVSKLPGSFHSRVILACVLIQLGFQYSIFIADQSD
jgi:Na+/H+ antiporter NhaA